MSCNKEIFGPKNNQLNVFEEEWKYIDENYVYFDYKNINWAAVKAKYQSKVSSNISEDSLFSICSSMLSEIKDGHSFLTSSSRFYNYDFTNGYNVYFDLDITIKSKYLKNNFQTEGYYTYGIIQDTIGYVYYERFSNDSYFNNVMQFFKDKNVSKIIIDIRNNQGGEAKIPQYMVGYFVSQETLVGYLQFKGGKEHNNFTSKIELKAVPQSIYFGKKVNVLINRNSFSAASYFAGMVNNLPNFKLIGQITGGGGGAGSPYELPNGWIVAVANEFFMDSKGNQIENGISPNMPIENTKKDLKTFIDKMLEKAIEK